MRATSALTLLNTISTNTNGLNDASPSDLPSRITSIFADNAFLKGLISGAVTRGAKEALLHPLDSVRTRQQMPQLNMSTLSIYSDLYSGVGPALIGGVPAGAVFFGVKDWTKEQLRAIGVSSPVATIVAVCLANIPYWLVKSPAELIKTKQQGGGDSQGSLSDLLQLYNRAGVSGLYGSYGANVVYAIPADVLKFLSCAIHTTSEGGRIGGAEAAVAGALAGVIAQLDVVRTRVMVDDYTSSNRSAPTLSRSPLQRLRTIQREETTSALLAGLAPRVLRAICSGAIQFVSYEWTQNALSR